MILLFFKKYDYITKYNRMQTQSTSTIYLQIFLKNNNITKKLKN